MNLNWLRLDLNILNDEKIKIIRKYPSGDSIFILWIGILCLAMKNENPGHIQTSEGMSMAEYLSSIFDIELKTVQLGIQIFSKFKMIQLVDKKLINILNFQKHQSLDKIAYRREQARQRQIRFRERTKKLTRDNDNVTVSNALQTPMREEKRREDQIREEKSRVDKNLYTYVIDYWNSKKIIVHTKNLDKIKRKLKTSLKEYSENEIKNAIDNYDCILKSDNYYFNYRWGLCEFLQRGIEKFIDREIAHNNYLVKNKHTRKFQSEAEAYRGAVNRL